jgi:hypothetical protein
MHSIALGEDLCDEDNELSGPIKASDFPDQLNNY